MAIFRPKTKIFTGRLIFTEPIHSIKKFLKTVPGHVFGPEYQIHKSVGPA